MRKSKICWVTTDWFVDVDLPIIPLLLEYYSIHWIVVLYKHGRFKEHDFCQQKHMAGLTVEFVHVNQRARHPRTIIDYWHIATLVNRCRADLNYFDMVPGSPYMLLPYFRISRHKTVFVAHDGSVKSIMGKMAKVLFKLGYGIHALHVHMFSKSQANEFNKNYPGKNVTVIPLMPKDYGKISDNVTVIKNSFLSFGTMHREKNIGLLIQAVEELYEEGLTDIMVSICGQASDWKEMYAPIIKHPQLFNLQLRMIANSEIPDLFASHQFIVYPYKAMSQSGALKVAYAYKKPVITSDLTAFKEEVKEGVNGFFFHSEDVDSLKKIIRRCVMMPEVEYRSLLSRVSDFVEKNYSADMVKKAYCQMFYKVLQK